METPEIRPLRAWEEYRACEELQRHIWGGEFAEVAPASLLKICQRLGGVASGAFADDGTMVGFVFGVTGLERRDGADVRDSEDEDGAGGGDGHDRAEAGTGATGAPLPRRPVHWSHMLGVREGWRDHGIGRRLKEHQRDVLRDRGVERIYWTYDPLVARNAHFNLNRLGAEVHEYVVNMYGQSESELHRGLGTDRFVVVWRLTEHERGERPAPDPDRGAGELTRVPIPSDIFDLRNRDPEAAAGWRRKSRAAFRELLGDGWRIAGFDPDADPDRGAYLLVRG